MRLRSDFLFLSKTLGGMCSLRSFISSLARAISYSITSAKTSSAIWSTFFYIFAHLPFERLLRKTISEGSNYEYVLWFTSKISFRISMSELDVLLSKLFRSSICFKIVAIYIFIFLSLSSAWLSFKSVAVSYSFCSVKFFSVFPWKVLANCANEEYLQSFSAPIS